MRILIIEDDSKIARFLEKGLKEEGYAPHVVKDGAAGEEKALGETWDLIVLDRMLPTKDGLTICQTLRARNIGIPILMLSGLGSLENRVEGLNAGADDYLPKPFAFSELLARVRALSRRNSQDAKPSLEAGDLKLDLVTHKVSYREHRMDLTTREFSLLQFFMRRKGHVLSRTIIAESVWDYDFQTGTNVIDVYVNYLRSKLKKITGKDMIQTIRNRGYVFVADSL